jgi:hypothetical protein
MAEPDNALLDQTLAATRRTREVLVACGFTAVTGALFLLQAAQFYLFYLEFYGAYRYAPPSILVIGVALVMMASRLYSQRVWAAIAATAVTGSVAALMGFWYLFLVLLRGRQVNPLTALLPLACAATAVFAAQAIGPCKRTTAARQRAAAAGLDLDL